MAHLRLFQFSLRDQASNWLERLPAGSISTWEDLTTRFLAQFFPLGRTAKLRNDILMFQQHQVNKVASSCEIRSGPHDTQYCMENPEQAFVDYASSRTDKVGEQNRNPSSPKCVHFINSIVILRKEDKPEEEETMELNAAKDNDHNAIVNTEEEVIDVTPPNGA
ncbi:MAK10-like protein [Tanacetum coccineum]